MNPFIINAWEFIKKHSTRFLAGGAIVAELFGFWFMHKEAPVVHEKLKALPPTATNWDKIKTAAPIYLPAAAMLLISGGCIVGGAVVGEAKLMAMTNLAMASEAALQKYQEKVVNQLGPEKAQEFHDSVAKEVLSNEHATSANEIVATSHGTDVFCDILSGRKFTSAEAFLQNSAAELNQEASGSMDRTIEVNDWYYKIELEPVKLGRGWCWNPDHPLKVEFGVPYKLDDGRWCRDIVYFNMPRLPDGSAVGSRTKW